MAEQLRMIWPIGQRAPEGLVQLPKGYSIRSFRDGDEELYAKLLGTSDLGEWTVERIHKEIDSNPLAPEGVFFVTLDDKPVATALAYDRTPRDQGKPVDDLVELGWVATLSSERGKRLGLIVCIEVLKYMLDKGYRNIYLLTDPWRVPAIKTYLKMGFEPDTSTRERKAQWDEVLQQIGFKYEGVTRGRFRCHEQSSNRPRKMTPETSPCHEQRNHTT